MEARTAGRLAGKRAVITGGTAGIGLATAQLFLQEGAQVAITGQNPDRLDEARRTLGSDVLVVKSDASSISDTETMIAEVGRAFGSIDVLFLNAGVAKFAPLDQVTEAFFDEHFDVNVKGVLFTVQEAAPLLRPGASVIMTTSNSNRIGLAGTVVCAATKAATRLMVRVLASELAARSIRVNAVCPGPIETPIFGKMGLPPEEVQSIAASLMAKVPLGRIVQPDEIARVALFLGSNDSSFVTGAEIVADGGWTDVGVLMGISGPPDAASGSRITPEAGGASLKGKGRASALARGSGQEQSRGSNKAKGGRT